MTVPLADLDPNVGGWFGVRGWDPEHCRRENHIDVPEGELCQGCFHPIAASATGYVLAGDDGAWAYWHHDCYWDHVEEGRATDLVESRLDGDYEPW